MRKANLDYLRVLAMLFIICHHCVINDFGLQNLLKNHTYVGIEKIDEIIILGFLNSCFIIGVNLFFLLSGYLGINFKWKKLIALIIKTYIIYGLIAISGVITGYLAVDAQFIKYLLDPLDMYWFIMTYILLYFTSPLLNQIIKSISINLAKKYFCGICVICFGYGFFIDKNLHINNGYSFLMAMILYILGGILRKWNIKVEKQKCFAGGVICSVINTLTVIFFYTIGKGNIS